MDTSHLDALRLGLSNEKIKLRAATHKAEIEIREVWIAQIEREIQGELKHLGIQDDTEMSDDELLKALT